MSDSVDPGPNEATPREDSEQIRPVVTRREFMAGAGAGLAIGAVVAGGTGFLRTKAAGVDRIRGTAEQGKSHCGKHQQAAKRHQQLAELQPSPALRETCQARSPWLDRSRIARIRPTPVSRVYTSRAAT